MLVENSSDELRVGVKGQSNSVIARSPRNSFRASLGHYPRGGRELDGLGSVNGYQIQLNYECREVQSGSQTAGAKLRCREGNSPDRQLRSRSNG